VAVKLCIQKPSLVPVANVTCPDGSAPVQSGFTFTCPTLWNTPAVCPPGYVPVPGVPGRCMFSPACPAGFVMMVWGGRPLCVQLCPVTNQLPSVIIYGASTYFYCSSAPGGGWRGLNEGMPCT
jgi:hypothetical protein